MEENIIKAIGNISTMPKNKWFELKDLFTDTEWSNINVNQLGIAFKAVMESKDNNGKLVYKVLGLNMATNKNTNGNYQTQKYMKV